MDELSRRKGKFFKVFKNPYFFILLVILLLAIVVRIYFFNANHGNQWYDESIYAMKSRVMAEKGISEGILGNGWHRGFIMEIFWSVFYKIGIGETAARITELILSVLAVLLTYLLGKELTDKKTSLIAAAFMAVFWLNLFYTARIMLTIPTLFFWIFTCYLFWMGYVKKKVWWVLPLLGVLFVVGMFTSLLYTPVMIFLLIFVLLTDRFTFLKNKWFYLAILVSIALVVPYLLWAQSHIGNAFAYWGATLSVGATFDKTFSTNSGIMGYIHFFPSYLGTLLLILFIVGVIKILDIFLGLDLVVKGDETVKKKLFLLLWVVVTIVANAILVPAFSVDYYLMQIFPAVFLILGGGIVWIGDLIEKYSKYLGIIVIVSLVLIGMWTQLTLANTMISYKADSFEEVRTSALWIKKDSTNVSDLVMSPSGVMTAYFAERTVMQYPQNESDFEKINEEKKPKYMIVSVYENPPEWTFDYNFRRNDTWIPVQAYYQKTTGQESPTLIIFKRK